MDNTIGPQPLTFWAVSLALLPTGFVISFLTGLIWHRFGNLTRWVPVVSHLVVAAFLAWWVWWIVSRQIGGMEAAMSAPDGARWLIAMLSVPAANIPAAALGVTGVLLGIRLGRAWHDRSSAI